MRELARRNFMQGAAALALGATANPAAAAARPAKLNDIDHIIVLTKENRSFDHYFGTLRGVRGFADGSSRLRQHDPDGPSGFVLPFRLDTTRTNAQRMRDLSHAWSVQHAAWNDGAMDRWLPAHRAVDGPDAPLTMGYLTRADLPFYYALADTFTICDAYHSSVFGPTLPNRFYLMTASIDAEGRFGKPALNNSRQTRYWETYPERLQRAGISWRIYHDVDDYYCNVSRYFSQYHGLSPSSPLYENAVRDRPLHELLDDLRRGNIPQVSWIVPPSTVTEHPDYLPAAGEDHTRQILEALWANPALWAKTAVILNYDENDGQFDHVAPPVPAPGTPGEFVLGQPVGLGFRVPCLVISPYSRGGYVCGAVFDHTSTLRLIEARFGVEIANLSRWRRATCGDLTTAFGFGLPPRLDVPPLPETASALRLAEQRAMRLPPPSVPARQTMPSQEPGSRPRRA
ncbi:MAG TPA: alkaline phosphatase family protein [Stellaceae bacterium]|nr:alkaline phosphatase family protein [Stellaceae bacterium]